MRVKSKPVKRSNEREKNNWCVSTKGKKRGETFVRNEEQSPTIATTKKREWNEEHFRFVNSQIGSELSRLLLETIETVCCNPFFADSSKSTIEKLLLSFKLNFRFSVREKDPTCSEMRDFIFKCLVLKMMSASPNDPTL